MADHPNSWYTYFTLWGQFNSNNSNTDFLTLDTNQMHQNLSLIQLLLSHQFLSQVPDDSFSIDDEISHLTKLSSQPADSTRRSLSGPRNKPRSLSSFKLLAGREGTGRFSSADRAYVLGQHIPVRGPWYVDCMDSEAYVSRFSDDGSLFVVGFRVYKLFCLFSAYIYALCVRLTTLIAST